MDCGTMGNAAECPQFGKQIKPNSQWREPSVAKNAGRANTGTTFFRWFSSKVAAIISDATGCDAELQAVKEAVGVVKKPFSA